MIENLANWIPWLFILTAVSTISMFHFANGKPNKLTTIIIFWSIVQSVLAYTGFYLKTDLIPPRFLIVLIAVVAFLTFGLTKKNRNWITANRNTKWSTLLHTVRIPIEIILFYLFANKMIPELMTFEGRNFDILAGLSAPIIGVLWLKKIITPKVLLIWNLLALAFVLFIFTNGILSSELPIQMFAFEQPNRAVYYFPFVLLPATIVPIVIYTHLTDIIKLRQQISAQKRKK